MSRLRDLKIAVEGLSETAPLEVSASLDAEIARNMADMGEACREIEVADDEIALGLETVDDLMDISDVIQSNSSTGLNETDLKMASVAVESIRLKLGLSSRKVSTESIRVYVPAAMFAAKRLSNHLLI
jgi:hypothetical protein